jgi:hypothetical protein
MIWRPTRAQQEEEIHKTWSIFTVGQDNPLHLRAIWGKGVPDQQPSKNFTYTAKNYPSIADRQKAFVDKALKLNGLGYNIYTTVNPVDPLFKGDEHNQLAVKDQHIVRRRYQLVDIDREVTVEPIHEDEIDEMFAFAFCIEKELFFDKGEEPISILSGNGCHIYIPVDLPNDDASKVQCQKLLKVLAGKYDNSTFKVDTSVYNAARITKVPGTIARKGIQSEDRPYRMAHVLE